jgi:imidazole glycerol-phosphate synthase subunit HisH
MIYVANFPFCNFFSLERYLRVRNKPYRVLAPGDQLSPSDHVILPGVGTYDQAMVYLRDQQLVPVLQGHVDRGGRLLGICLGMQLLFEFSEESPGVPGLALLPGGCVPIPPAPGFRVPHIGWNHLIAPPEKGSHSFLCDVSPSSGYSHADYYFVHSYVVEPSQSSVISAYFQHPAGPLCASVASSNISGVQFHPEKSGADGYALLDRLLAAGTSA